MIIFDELHYAESLLKNGFDTYEKGEYLRALAKYYRYMGDKPKTIYEKILSFCLKYDPNFNEEIFGYRIESAIKRTEKWKLRLPVEIYITEKELDNIRSVKNFKLEKILFMMLVMSRSLKISGGYLSKEYYLNESFASILTMAKVYVNKSKREDYRYELSRMGFIDPNSEGKKKSNGKDNLRLLYADENSEKKLFIESVDLALKYYNPICEMCGKEMEFRKMRLICDNCYKEKRRLDTANKVKKFRNKECNQSSTLNNLK